MRLTVKRILPVPGRERARCPCHRQPLCFSGKRARLPIVAKTGFSRFLGYAPLNYQKHRRALAVKARADRDAGGAACLGLDGQRTTV